MNDCACRVPFVEVFQALLFTSAMRLSRYYPAAKPNFRPIAILVVVQDSYHTTLEKLGPR